MAVSSCPELFPKVGVADSRAVFTTDVPLSPEVSESRARCPNQKVLSAAIDDATLQALTARVDDFGKARLMSLSAKTTGIYLAPSSDTAHASLLTPEEFRVAVRLRLGLPVYPAVQDCNQCRKKPSDIYGGHSLTCMTSGYRTRAHNSIRDTIHQSGRVLRTPAAAWT